MRIFVLCIFCFLSAGVKSQTYSVVYRYDPAPIRDTSIPADHLLYSMHMQYQRLLFNDTLSLAMIQNRFKEKGNRANFSNRNFHHSKVYLRNSNRTLNISTWPKKHKPTGVLAIAENPKWIQSGRVVTFLGYLCSEAYYLKTANDTVFAIYTTQIPVPYGPWAFGGLPGLILDFYDGSSNTGWTALSVTKINIKIRLPKRIRIVDSFHGGPADMYKKEKKNSYQKGYYFN
jgi:GLPGLI family protein